MMDWRLNMLALWRVMAFVSFGPGCKASSSDFLSAIGISEAGDMERRIDILRGRM